MKVAIVGASGAVGQEFLRVLDERNFPLDELVLFGSKRSAGTKYTFRGKQIEVKLLHTADIHRAADAARHRAVFNGAPAISCHAAGITRPVIACYLYAIHHHILHRSGAIIEITEIAEQTRIFVICRNG